MSTLVSLARSTSQENVASKNMAPDTHSSSLGDLQQRGVGFTVSTSIASRLENLSTGYSDCMISRRLLLKNKRYATLFSVYAPIVRAELSKKDKFYSELRSCLQSTLADEKEIILGNSMRVGQDADSWKGVLGKHGVSNCNDIGDFLLVLCTEQQLVITNTIFLDMSSVQTLAPNWLRPCAQAWPQERHSYQSDVQRWMPHRSSPSALQT